jgi:hypothetical protein
MGEVKLVGIIEDAVGVNIIRFVVSYQGRSQV